MEQVIDSWGSFIYYLDRVDGKLIQKQILDQRQICQIKDEQLEYLFSSPNLIYAVIKLFFDKLCCYKTWKEEFHHSLRMVIKFGGHDKIIFLLVGTSEVEIHELWLIQKKNFHNETQQYLSFPRTIPASLDRS